MKITDVEVAYLKIPSISEISNGTQDVAVVLVHTDEGITGIGEAETSPHVAKAVVDAPRSHSVMVGLKEVLIGENPLDIERLWRKMYQATIYMGRRGAVLHALSGVDIALWDIKGKAYDKPIIVLEPFGGTDTIAPAVQELADDVVPWDQRQLIDAIKREARHEETTRFDMIEFKLD